MFCLLDCKSLNFPRENVHLLGVIIDLLMPDSSAFQIYVNVHQAKKFCGRPSSLPIILKFNSNLIYVYFHSWKSRGAPGPGFNLTYLHVAGELLTGTSFLYQILLQEKVFPAKESQTSRSSLPKQLQNLWLFCWADLDFDILLERKYPVMYSRLSETLRDIRTSTNQIFSIEENTNRTTKFHK